MDEHIKKYANLSGNPESTIDVRPLLQGYRPENNVQNQNTNNNQEKKTFVQKDSNLLMQSQAGKYSIGNEEPFYATAGFIVMAVGTVVIYSLIAYSLVKYQ